MNTNFKGSIIVLVSSLLYCGNSLISKLLIGNGIDPLSIIFLRYVFATSLLFVFIVCRNRKKILISGKIISKVVLLGLCLFGNGFGYFFSLVYLDLSIAIILLYTYPALAAIATIAIFKEKVPATVILAIIATFIGILLTLNLFSADFSKISVIGLILAAIGAICSVCYLFLNRSLGETVDVFTINLYSFLVTCCLFGLLVPFSDVSFAIPLPDITLIFLSGFFIAAGFVCYTFGIKLLTPCKAAIICSSEPVLTIVFAALLLGESITISQGTGVLFVVTAIILLQLQPKKTLK